MKLQYLGTAAAEGFPALFCACEACVRARKEGGKNLRLRAGAIINDTVLIDFPPDAMTFSQRLGVDFSNIRDVFVTHSHSDHFDAEDLAMRRNPVFCRLADERPLNVYANKAAIDRFFEYARHEDGDPATYLNFTELAYFTPFTAENGLTFTHLPADHAHDENAGIYLVEDGEKTLLYAHDTGAFPEETMVYLKTKSIDLISIDCTYGKQPWSKGHMGIPADRQMVDALREAGAVHKDTVVIVNHFTHNCGLLHTELEEQVKDDGFLVSYDGMIVEI